jgi:hypothetical protein
VVDVFFKEKVYGNVGGWDVDVISTMKSSFYSVIKLSSFEVPSILLTIST